MKTPIQTFLVCLTADGKQVSEQFLPHNLVEEMGIEIGDDIISTTENRRYFWKVAWFGLIYTEFDTPVNEVRLRLVQTQTTLTLH